MVNHEVYLIFDISAHRRFLKYPDFALSSLEVMWVTFQLAEFVHTYMWEIVPAKEPLVARIGQPLID